MQETGSWQEVLRALCALEAVVQQGSTAACGEIAVHFQVRASVEPVLSDVRHPQPPDGRSAVGALCLPSQLCVPVQHICQSSHNLGGHPCSNVLSCWDTQLGKGQHPFGMLNGIGDMHM